MIMKSRVFIVLVSLVFIVTFVMIACTSQSQATAPVVELTVWDVPENEAYTIWWKNYVEDFNKANPNIKVTREIFESEAYKRKIGSALVAGTQPDIFYAITGDISFEYYAEGKMLAIQDLYDITPYTDAGRLGVTFNGKMIAHPLYIAITSFYYNKAQFAKAGIDPQKWTNPIQPTWNEFINACDKLKAAGLIPIAMGNAEKWPMMSYIAGAQNRYGGTKELFDAISGAGSYTAPGFLKGAEVVQLLVKNDYFPKGFNGIGGTDKFTLFTKGNGAMFYYGPWVISLIKENAPQGFEFGMFKYPSFPDGNPDSQSDIEGGIDALWVSSTTKHPEAVAKFLQPLTTVDNALSFMKETNFVPTIKGIYEKAKIVDVDPAVLVLLQYSEEAKHSHPWWDWCMPAPVAEELLNISQLLSMGEITPKEFVDRLETKARPE